MSDNVLNMSESEFWEELYKDIPILLQPGEKTIPMMIEELDRPVEYKTMKNRVMKWVADGKLKSVGIRVDSSGHLVEAYILVV